MAWLARCVAIAKRYLIDDGVLRETRRRTAAVLGCAVRASCRTVPRAVIRARQPIAMPAIFVITVAMRAQSIGCYDFFPIAIGYGCDCECERRAAMAVRFNGARARARARIYAYGDCDDCVRFPIQSLRRIRRPDELPLMLLLVLEVLFQFFAMLAHLARSLRFRPCCGQLPCPPPPPPPPPPVPVAVGV